MKRLTSIAAALLLSVSPALADEGMWLPALISQRIEDMHAKGFKLSAEDIYSINRESLKDAVMLFGGGCTGELVSPEGLLFTNHHCGYSYIQKHSSVEHDYLKDGFWALERKEELPNPGLSVKFLDYMEDVTAEILGAEDRKAVEKELIRKAVEGRKGAKADVEEFYYGNRFYLFVYREFTDIRLVGAPPSSIGKFGGDTDNWMWPRQTCDYSMFRVYAGKNNEPADYAEDNVPYTPKQSLKISLKGVNEGDFAMVMGYPGRTQRFQSASMLEQMIKRQDVSIAVRTLRQDIMKEGMEADPVVRLQYANKYAGSSNGWKKWIGEKKAFEKLNIIGREEQKEAEFTKWVNGNKKRKAAYGSALEEISNITSASSNDDTALRLLMEAPFKVGLCDLVGAFSKGMMTQRSATPEDSLAIFQAGKDAVKPLYKDFNEPLERKIAAGLLKYYRDNARPSDFLSIGGHDFATMDIDAYVDSLFDSSFFSSESKLDGKDITCRKDFVNDAATEYYNAVVTAYLPLYKKMSSYNAQLARANKSFAAGLLEWEKGEPSYPDANSTMRLTYGTVKGYSPADGVTYKYYTTLTGVIEKEDPDNYEFRVPAKVKDLYYARDFGQYADVDGVLPTCFLTNCDITGGNSGSPVLDAEGRLIGLAFDGNWESMSSDVMFEPDLQRCICVDIRYVLFVMDKFGGAGYLLDEMNIEK